MNTPTVNKYIGINYPKPSNVSQWSEYMNDCKQKMTE